MTGFINSQGPTYISSHSADVILSDIRPIKLQFDALRCINVLLDEFLYNVLSSARSLSTDKLRVGLLKVLPTSLGKDALLEAEVELRAYWDRTGPISASDVTQYGDDQGKGFHLQWVFELLRIKCEAYSTLNESDEDPEAESRLQTRMSQGGGLGPPKASLIAPASLYLTAILESVCEHILSNVGRVAARDSSRTSATVQDLFVALCEDDSIYGLFKAMKMYEQVETLSKLSKPRRSKSSTRLGDKPNTSSPKPEFASFKDSTSRRTSSDSSTSMATATSPSIGPGNSRSSFDKTKAMRIFSKPSTDRDPGYGEGQRNHKKTDSTVSDDRTKRPYDGVGKPSEDAALQEFDNLMRSDATMKVSLTPDRLKSMDVYNKEKSQRPNRQLFASDSPTEVDRPSSRALGRRSSLRHMDNVESIIEDEEETTPSKSLLNRSRQSTFTASSTVTRPDVNPRARSFSASNPLSSAAAILKKHSATDLGASSPPPAFPGSGIRRRPVPKALDTSTPNSNRTQRVVQDSLDLDDMGRSDDEAQEATATSPKGRTPFAVSSNTRDLIDFLSEGPPDDTPPVSMANRSAVSLENGKAKSSGRLQRMISKLSMGSSNEKLQPRAVNGSSDDFSRKTNRKTPPATPSTPIKSPGNMVLANRPIPPRPPPPPVISPPSSSQESLVYTAPPNAITNRPEQMPSPADFSTPSPKTREARAPGFPSPREMNGEPINGFKRNVNGVKPQSPSTEKGSSFLSNKYPVEQRSPKKSPISPSPPKAEMTSSQLSMEHAREMHNLFLKATTADECRLIFDMFIAKSGIALEPPNYDKSPSVTASAADVELEHVLVELLLGGRDEDESRSEASISEASPLSTTIPLESVGVPPPTE